MNIGDIVHLNWTPQEGQEMAGEHYGVVLSTSSFNNLYPYVIVAPITTHFKKNFENVRVKVETLAPSIHGYICLDNLKSIDPDGRNFETTPNKLTQSCKRRCREILVEIFNL